MLGMLNCSDVDRALEETTDFLLFERVGGIILVVTMAIVSIGLIVRGERFSKPLAGIVGAIAGGGGTIILTQNSSEMTCILRLSIAGVVSILICVLAICLVKTGLFLIGASGGGVLAHLIWQSLPLSSVRGPFTLFGNSGYYYISVSTGTILGALVSQLKRKHFIRYASALLGSVGLALSLFLSLQLIGVDIPVACYLAIVVGVTIMGVFIQGRNAGSTNLSNTSTQSSTRR